MRRLLSICLVLMFLLLGCSRIKENHYQQPESTQIVLSNRDDIREIMQEDLYIYFNMNRDEIIKSLGSEYEIGTMAIEESHMIFPVYSFKNGLTFYFAFDEASCFPNQIECSDKIKIGEVKSGMSFSEVESKLGKKEIIETWIASEDVKAYKVIYKLDKIQIEFLSYNEDGANSSMMVQALQ